MQQIFAKDNFKMKLPRDTHSDSIFEVSSSD